MRWRNLAGAALMALAMAPRPAAAELPSKAAVLDFIGRYEAPGGYDQAHAAVPESPPRPLTAMTIREVLAWQKRIRPRAVSTAAGRYQVIHDTLASARREIRDRSGATVRPGDAGQVGATAPG